MRQINTIFLVDDDTDDQEVFGDALAKVNSTIKLYTANDGIDALEKLTTAVAPDLIFLDINMPRMNGIQLLETIKKDQKLSNIPVVMYSTSSLPEHKTNTLSLGAAYYLVKPETFTGLCHEIDTLVHREWAR
jgi:CheY-like chemotaxis protein